MKKELIMLGSMVAMSAALSSCCSQKQDYAYKNPIPPAPRVTPTKGYNLPYIDSNTSVVRTPISQQKQSRSVPVSQQKQSRSVPVSQQKQSVSCFGQRQPCWIMLPPNDCCEYSYPSNCCEGYYTNDCCEYSYPSNCCEGYYTSDCCAPCVPCIQDCGGWSIPVHFDFRLNWKGRHHLNWKGRHHLNWKGRHHLNWKGRHHCRH